ncbi:MAG: hypothetical protein MUD16_02020 [Desulfobacterales bacterium]|nr:hypothetical protein [Desulfobacterales bacterium]
MQAAPWHVDTVTSREATPELLENFDVHVLGNMKHARPEVMAALVHQGRHVLFEHDVRICHWRGNFPAACDPIHRWLGRCICPHRPLRSLIASSLGMIFLTHHQLSVYRRNPFFRPPAVQVLGSSVFGQEFFDRVARVRSGRLRTDRRGTCIAYSAHRIKGFRAALSYCRKRGVEPQVIQNINPQEVLDLMQRCAQFVFLPARLEPAGRMPVEARFLGCEVVTNRHVGVTGEAWWHLPDSQALEVLRDAGPRFWRIVQQLGAMKASGRRQAGEALGPRQEPAR